MPMTSMCLLSPAGRHLPQSVVRGWLDALGCSTVLTHECVFATQETTDIETGGASMYSLSSHASFASSKHSRLTSAASSASLAAPSFTSLHRSEAVSTTLSELYKKHGNVSSAAHAYKRLVRQKTQESQLVEAAEEEEEEEGSEEGPSSAAVEATQAVMMQLIKEAEKATAATARQLVHLRETQGGLNSMLTQLEMMTMVWSRDASSS